MRDCTKLNPDYEELKALRKEVDRLESKCNKFRKALRHIAYSNACDHEDMQCVREARTALEEVDSESN